MKRVRVAAAFALAMVACNAILGIDPLNDTPDASDARPSDSGGGADASSDRGTSFLDSPADASDAPTDQAATPPSPPCDGSACDFGPIEACDHTSDCTAGFTCYLGVCHILCDPTDAAGCSPSIACANEYDTDAQVLLPVGVCLRSCFLDRPDACGLVPALDDSGRAGCVYDYEHDASDCQMMHGGYGVCPNGHLDCAPGSACLGIDSTHSKCEPWCLVDGAVDPCEAGLTCRTTDTVFYDDGARVGICQ